MADKIDDGGSAFAHMAADGHGDYRPSLTKRRILRPGPNVIACIYKCVPQECADGETMEQMFARKSFSSPNAMIKANEAFR